MKKFKVFIALLLTLSMIMSQVAFSQMVEDISGHWAAKNINLLLNMGIISGYPDGSIKPDNTITRAEFVTLVNRTLGYNDIGDSGFPDVHSSSWYYDSFSIAKKVGYVVGDQNGNANPNRNITRAEVAVIFARTLNLNSSKNNSTFIDDSSFASWARSSIIAMQENQLVSGYPDGTFGAQNNLTRAEGFTLLANIIKRGLLNGENITDDSSIPVTGITTAPSTVNTTVGSSRTLTATILPENATNKNVTWLSDNASIATVNANGVIKAIAVGTTTIRAITVDGEFTATSAVKVSSGSSSGGGGSYNPPSTPQPTPTPSLTSDNDGDKLPDYLEDEFGTSQALNDTDGDGLSDYYEIVYTFTDPTLIDSDNNGINDGDEDADNDGLTNKEEFNLDTHPLVPDTDNDGLNDSFEVKTFFSSPLFVDTDGDTLTDEVEYKLGTNPNLMDSNGNGINDADEVYQFEVNDDDTNVSVSINAQGNALNEISIHDISDISSLAENDSVLSVIDINVSGDIDSAKITIPFDIKEVPNGDINNLAIYYYDDETLTLEKLEGQLINATDGTVSAVTTHFSKFVLLYVPNWRMQFETELNKPESSRPDNPNDEIQFADVVFVIDESSSMEDNIKGVENDPNRYRVAAAKAFVDALMEGDRAGVIGFSNDARVLQTLTILATEIIFA